MKKKKIDFLEIILTIIVKIFAFMGELIIAIIIIFIAVIILFLIFILVMFIIWLFENGLSGLGEILWCGIKGC